MIKKCPYIKKFDTKKCIKLLEWIEKNWKRLNPPIEKRGIESIIKHKKNNIPFFILITAILSVRTKDRITYKASKNLLKLIDKPKDLLNLSEKQITNLIYPVGFYKKKAKNIKKFSEILIKNYDGKVPDKIEELLKLPGVGKKVANLVLTIGFGKSGICVDTHVHRISNSLGLVNTETAEETEKQLKKLLPTTYRKKINKLFIGFGQTVCKSIKPKCNECPIYLGII